MTWLIHRLQKISCVPLLLFSFLALSLVSTSSLAEEQQSKDKDTVECINIFYDQGPSGYWMGRTYASMLQNLLGHFPQFQQIVSPIELYEKGDIEKCRATFYLGSYFENKIPKEFLEEYAAAKKPVAWFGYSIWKLNNLNELFGFQYEKLTTLNYEIKDEKGYPTFFRWIDYKGETFLKFAEWDKNNKDNFIAPFEQVQLKETNSRASKVLAWSKHNGTGEIIPYAIRNKNKFYIADIPFSYLHEADRYLITADLLFDILNVPAKNEKLALLRLEDIHPIVPLADVYNMSAVLKQENVPVNISLIPIFFDPYETYTRLPSEEYVTMDRKPEFMSFIHESQANGASFIWHGVTHQYKTKMNPHNGSSGDDFEFWDAVSNSPVEEDSVAWVLNRLNDGIYTIKKSGLAAPNVWLTPHYQASALDYLIFARVFPWNVGRVIYFNFYAQNLPENDGKLWIRDANSNQERIRAFEKAKIEVATNAPWSGQFFPYEIFGDIYGQRVIPENIGNSQPYISEHVVRTRSAEEIVRDAKRNLVIRDAWASLFYHPYLLQSYQNDGRGTYPGDPHELKYIIQEIKKLGYRFVSAEDFAKKNLKRIRPEPIYRLRSEE